MRTVFLLGLALLLMRCADESTEPPPSAVQTMVADAAVPATCTIASSCVAVDVDAIHLEPCCTLKSDCGYVLPQLDPLTMMYFPDTKDYIAMLTQDDPNGRCAPESVFFGPQPGLNEERYEADGVEDILVASTCASFHIAAFTLPGCCLPDDTCGLSTHSDAPLFEGWTHDPDAPFSHAECVHAEILNQQFRDSTLGALARLHDGGSCSYSEIDARQPNNY